MSIAQRFSHHFRDKKWELFTQQFSFTKDARVLDIGYQNDEYQDADNYLEKHYPHPEHITALGIEESEQFQQRYPMVKTVRYDGQHFPFSENEFDIAWSNATLEHVGTRAEQVQFLKEIYRTARSGFITTPNKGFPLEVHTRLPFIHWLPKPLFSAIVKMLGKGWAAGEYMDLLSSRTLHVAVEAAGWENYTIHRQKFLGFTLQFIIVFHKNTSI